jgi:hypothetical protein
MHYEESLSLLFRRIEEEEDWRLRRSSMTPLSMRFGVRSRKLSNVGQSLDGWLKMYYLELLRASEGTLSRWSRHLRKLAPTNLARKVGYGPFSLWVIHKEGLCRSADINRLMMMMFRRWNYFHKMFIYMVDNTYQLHCDDFNNINLVKQSNLRLNRFGKERLTNYCFRIRSPHIYTSDTQLRLIYYNNIRFIC